MKAVQDFNYKVALASGVKHLQAGKLRQAEEQFRYLVSKFPRADGGYRGLARVQVELGDRAAALTTLRDGAAALAKVGDRVVAIDLLREATQLDPLDLSVHRRLASSLALAGDVSTAAEEYVRFASAEVEAGDESRARLETSYAIETLGEIPKLRELARSVGLALRTPDPSASHPLPGATAEPAPEAETVPPPDASWPAAEPEPWPAPSWPGSEAAREPEPDPRLAYAFPSAAAEPETAPAPAASNAMTLEERASDLVASRDPDAGRVGVEAATALRDEGKVHAASDLLLQLVAAGIDVHEAERELIAVAQALGRSDLAEERARLLTQASRLG